MVEIEGYSDLEVIGSGGFSLVYRARQDRFNRLVAIKVLNLPALSADTERRFLRECQIAGGVSNHPNIVTLHDAGLAANGQPFLVFEYMSGGSLASRISATGVLPVEEVARIGAKLAGALASIHAATILHRDVKPSNVLLSAYDEPCLADFGISFVQSTLHATSMTSSLTPLFSAPEVVDGEPASAASDVYSLGATLYAGLSGHAPFAPAPGESLARTLLRIMSDPAPPVDRPDLPAAIRDAIEAMLSRDASARPSARAVSDILSGRSDGPRTMGPVGDPDATVRRAAISRSSGAAFEPTDPATVLRANRDRPPSGASDQAAGPAASGPVAPSPVPSPSPPPGRRRRPAALIGGGVGVAALAAGLTVVLLGSGHSAPLAITRSAGIATATTIAAGPAPTASPSTEPTTTASVSPSPATAPVVTEAVPATAPPDPAAAVIAQDEAQAGPLLDHWVAQLGAFKSSSSALAARQAEGDRFGAVLLISSSDYISKSPGYLDVVLDRPFADSSTAVAWCQDAGLTPSTCFAVYLSHDTPFSPSTYRDW